MMRRLSAWRHKRRGDAHRRAWRLEEAIASYRAALALDPRYADVHNNLGVVPEAAGRRAEAVASLEAALAIDPSQPDAYVNLGNILAEQGLLQEAIARYAQAVRADPARVDAHAAMADLYRDLGRLEEARQCDQRVLDLQPGDAVRIRVATALPAVPRSEEEMERARVGFRAGIEGLLARGVSLADPLVEIGQTPFLLPYQGRNDRELLTTLARLYAEACPGLLAVAPHTHRALRARRRVGFHSSHFLGHSVGAWFARAIDQMAASAPFDVVLITPEGTPRPELARTFPSVTSHAAIPLDLPAARARIAALELDVLCYADIGMNPLSYFLAFSRLAPVQCNMLGHPVTSGIPAVDYFLSSALCEGPDAQAHYSERLVALASLPAFISRPALPPPRSRAELGLPADRHLYVCPTMLHKLHPAFDRAIGGILRRDPLGEVLLFGDSRFAHWRRAVEERHAAVLPDVRDRIRFLPWQSGPDLLALLGVADVALDTWHFGAATTTFLMLAAGIPVVSLPGEFVRGRMTLGIYRRMGMEECIAGSEQEYVDLAVRIASDAGLRQTLRERIAATCPGIYDDAAMVPRLSEALAALAPLRS